MKTIRMKGQAPRLPTDAERRVIGLVAQGMTNKEIAGVIGTTDGVVKNYIRAIYDKLGLWNRVELTLWHTAHQKELS